MKQSFLQLQDDIDIGHVSCLSRVKSFRVGNDVGTEHFFHAAAFLMGAGPTPENGKKKKTDCDILSHTPLKNRNMVLKLQILCSSTQRNRLPFFPIPIFRAIFRGICPSIRGCISACSNGSPFPAKPLKGWGRREILYSSVQKGIRKSFSIRIPFFSRKGKESKYRKTRRRYWKH